MSLKLYSRISKVDNRTAKTAEVDKLRFSDGDLKVVGTLEYGQFGVVSVTIAARFVAC